MYVHVAVSFTAPAENNAATAVALLKCRWRHPSALLLHTTSPLRAPKRRSMASPVALISGASRGIGLATARLFASEGWDVVSVSRSHSPDAPSALRHAPIDLLEPGAPRTAPLLAPRPPPG